MKLVAEIVMARKTYAIAKVPRTDDLPVPMMPTFPPQETNPTHVSYLSGNIPTSGEECNKNLLGILDVRIGIPGP
jgi:hypothetical protein